MQVAAIDCGTNSIKLLIGSVVDGDLDVLVRDSRVVRLGEGVDRTGELSPLALTRTFAAVEEFARVIAEHEIPTEQVRFCATSATRDASNAEVFAAGVVERLGVRPEVLSGAEEAALAFAGATSSGEVPEPALVVDIGGGSTELVLGEDAPRQAVSMDIGSVRLTERHLPSDPPTDDEVAACLAEIEKHLDGCGVDIGAASSVVGTSGTIKTIACGVLGLDGYDRSAFDGAHLKVSEISEYVDRLVAKSVPERRSLPYMHPGRADVIAAGALIWQAILARADTDEALVSEADLLHGIAAGIAP